MNNTSTQLLQVHFSAGAMGSFQKYASFHASFKRGARVADDEDQGEKASVDVLNGNAGRAGRFGRGSRVGSSVTDISSNASSINYRRSPPRHDRFGSESFWCGAFCMHLPGLASRRRATMQQQQSMSLSEPDARASSTAPAEEVTLTRASVVSKAASMERFKHSSSSSGVAFDRAVDGEEEEDDDEEVSAYFDLPLELLRSSSVDMESPVTAAFVFDSGRAGQGLLKKSVLPDQLPNLDFSFEFPAPPAFTTPSWPRS